MTKREAELKLEIASLQSQQEYITNMISLLMAEANLIDAQIEEITRSGLLLKIKIRDLEAELKDTI